MRSSTRLALLVSLSISASGCFVDIDPHTVGEQGHLDFALQDGLCAGGVLGDRCDLSVPVAVGAHLDVLVDPHGAKTVPTLSFEGEGAVTVESAELEVSDDGERSWYAVSITVSGAGDGAIVASDGAGQYDRVSLRGAAVAALACGRFPSGATKDFRFPDLAVSSEVTLAVAGERLDRRLGCRALDASGAPILSADAISWSFVGAHEGVSLSDDEPFAILGDEAQGATVVVDAEAPGEVTIRAESGAASAEIAVSFQ